MARSLGSFYDRPGTPVCPDRRCVDERTGERSLMVEIGVQVFECPNAHGKRRVVARDPRPYPDLPREKPGALNQPINAQARRAFSPFVPAASASPAKAPPTYKFVQPVRTKVTNPNGRPQQATDEQIVDAFRRFGTIRDVSVALRVADATIRRALDRAGVERPRRGRSVRS